MKIECPTCKYEYDPGKDRRCPRCGSPAPRKGGCENCSGCSLWKGCEDKNQEVKNECIR